MLTLPKRGAVLLWRKMDVYGFLSLGREIDVCAAVTESRL